MAAALEGMLGSHDFAAFQRAGSRRAHSRTTILNFKFNQSAPPLNGDILNGGS